MKYKHFFLYICLRFSSSYSKAAKTFLAIRNLCGSLCAIGVSFFFWLYASELAYSTEGIKDSGYSNMINISNPNEKQVEFENSTSYRIFL